jgi:hypothetical protein
VSDGDSGEGASESGREKHEARGRLRGESEYAQRDTAMGGSIGEWTRTDSSEIIGCVFDWTVLRVRSYFRLATPSDVGVRKMQCQWD